MVNLSKQSGVGLIEVLITALILSTALLALAGLQTRSLQYNTSAYLRSQANILAYDILDRVRIGSDPGVNAIPQPNVNELAAAQLPGGEGKLECASRTCTVTLSWTEPTVNQDQDGSEKSTFTYQSQI